MRTKGNLKLKGLLAALGSAVAVMGAFAPIDAAAQTTIVNSKHDLSSGSTGGNKFDGTDQICVFCHTPHGANTGVQAPLWNKTAPDTTNYQLYNTGWSSTIDGTVNVGGVSLACLSCHDGSLAIATMINKPGSGGWVETGSLLAGAWTGGGGVDPLTGKMKTDVITNLGLPSGGPGPDLRNDHPISIQYCGGGLTANGGTMGAPADPLGTCADADFNLPKTAVVGGSSVFWMEPLTGVTVGRQKTDLPLYARVGITGPAVECASCHDPHAGGGTFGTFLRNTNTGSALCLTCHKK